MPKWTEVEIHPSGYAPDLAPQTRGIISASTNLYPTTAGVATLPLGVLQIPPEAAAIQTIGAFSGFASDGTWRLWKATRQHIYRATASFTTWQEADTAQTFSDR